jgi:hypothetical protein
LDGSPSVAGKESPLEGGRNRFGSLGDVSATAKTALPDRDIPPGLTALSRFRRGNFPFVIDGLQHNVFYQFHIVLSHGLMKLFQRFIPEGVKKLVVAALIERRYILSQLPSSSGRLQKPTRIDFSQTESYA